MYSSSPLLWPKAARELCREREESYCCECVMCTLCAFVCIKCCSNAPQEEARAHPSNTVEGRGRGVTTLMDGCVFLHSLLQCGDRAAEIGAAHNECKQANTHTLLESCLKRWLRKRAAGPCWLPEEVTKSWTQPLGLDSVPSPRSF